MEKTDFISLIDALNILAECVQPTPFPLDQIPPPSPEYLFWKAKLPEIDEERKFSTAAELLNTALRRSDNVQIWHEYSKQERCHFPNKLREQEGRQILISAINVAAVRQQDRCRHLSECFEDGLDPLGKPILFSVARQEWQPGDPVGFDRSELIEFLNQNNIPHPFEYHITQEKDESEREDGGTGADDNKWGWPDMESFTGLTRDKIRYRAEQLGFEMKKQDPNDKNSPPGLRICQLNKIASYKRSNAVT